MPIEYLIDRERRLVSARGHGTLTEEDLWKYQEEVWSRAELAGFNELMDMSDVARIVSPSVERLKALAEKSAGMDTASSSRLAIIAPAPLAYGLGRMYETYRGMDARSTKQVGVFRARDRALEYLGRSAPKNKDG